MFKKKLLFAALAGPPFVWVWYQGAPYLNALMAVAAVVAADEVATMGAGKSGWPSRIAAMLGAAAIYLPGAFSALPWTVGEGLLVAMLVAFLVHLALPGEMSSVGNRTAVSLLGAVYGAVPLTYLIATRQIPEHGRALAFLALSLSWLCDTFAYAGGRAFGRTKLYPKMSPNKTVEGLLCGALAAAIAAAIVARVAELPFGFGFALALGFASALWGQIGDICESMLKRSWGVKDAGWLMFGHGGVLDRFDAVFFVSPLIYFAHRWFL